MLVQLKNFYLEDEGKNIGVLYLVSVTADQALRHCHRAHEIGVSALCQPPLLPPSASPLLPLLNQGLPKCQDPQLGSTSQSHQLYTSRPLEVASRDPGLGNKVPQFSRCQPCYSTPAPRYHCGAPQHRTAVVVAGGL